MEDKYIVSEELYKVVLHCTKGSFDPALPEGFNVGEVDEKTYKEAIKIIDKKMNGIIGYYEQYGINEGFDPDLSSDFKNLINEYSEIKYDKRITPEEINKRIELSQKIINTNYLLYFLQDAKRLKEIYKVSLKHYKNVESLIDWETRFDAAYKERNMEKMKSILNEIATLNKKALVDFVNSKNDDGDDFAFLGHSLKTRTTDDLRNNFYTSIISTSLFTKEFNETFSLRYGYIMSPSAAISATPKDSYTNNKAKTEDELLQFSLLPKIYHPEEILSEMREYKTENDQTEDEREVYSEIVIKGFEPIGIFCFTNGLKELDIDYKYAMELQKNSPGLKLKVIDISKYRKGKKLEKMKLEMLNSIGYFLYNDSFKYKKEDVYMYEMFFEKLEELKKNDDYTVDDVKKAFFYNEEILKQNNDDLFDPDKKYSIEEVKYILGRGIYFNIDKILSGDAKIFSINRLGRLSKYIKDERCKSMMDKCYPGLAEFSVLVEKVNVTDEMYKEMKEKGQLTFVTMSKYLYKTVEKQLAEEKSIIASEKTAVRAELKQKQLRLDELLKRKEILEKEEKEYLKMRKLVDSGYKFELIKMDLDSANSSIEHFRKKIGNYQAEKEQKESELAAKLQLKEQEKIRQEEYNKKYKELLEELRILKKHPFINKKKIILKEQEIKELNNNSVKSSFGLDDQIIVSELENSIIFIDDQINYCKSHEEMCTQDIKSLKSKIIELFGTDDIEEIKKMIKKAEEVIENYSSTHLENVEFDIKDLQREIEKKQIEIGLIEEKERLLEEQKPQML